jgi:hypothetical protein
MFVVQHHGNRKQKIWATILHIETGSQKQYQHDLISILRKALEFFGEWTILFVHPQDN